MNFWWVQLLEDRIAYVSHISSAYATCVHGWLTLTALLSRNTVTQRWLLHIFVECAALVPDIRCWYSSKCLASETWPARTRHFEGDSWTGPDVRTADVLQRLSENKIIPSNLCMFCTTTPRTGCSLQRCASWVTNVTADSSLLLKMWFIQVFYLIWSLNQ